MNKLFLIILLISSLITSGCTTHNNIHQDTPWQESDLENLTIDLISKKYVEWMGFGPEGWVSYTGGIRDEAICAIAFQWKIKNGLLILYEDDGQTYCTMRKISLSKDRLIAEVDGEKRVYRRIKE